MFESACIETGRSLKTKFAALGFSLSVQMVIAAALVAAPLLFLHEGFPAPVDLLAPLTPSPYMPHSSAGARVVHANAAAVHARTVAAPTRVPDSSAERDASVTGVGPQSVGPTGLLTGEIPGVGIAGVPFIEGAITPAAPSAPNTPLHVKPRLMRVGGKVEAAKCIFCPAPAYPRIAVIARIEGVVQLDALISAGGEIQQLQALGGNPLLVGAAMTTVRNWRYAPTLLNGAPVEVETVIEIRFTRGE
jgi:protein TonB